MNKTNQNCLLPKIRSKYILKRVFDHLNQIRILNLVRYNKMLQNKVNKSIMDYKILYSKIEIEIIPTNDIIGTLHIFININKTNKQYYHIYFNNDKEEIKRNYIQQNENISTIKVIIDFEV